MPRVKTQTKKNELKEIIEWLENYAKKNGFRLNPNRAIVEKLARGLLINQKKYGARYCPCRRITGNLKEDRFKICPCKWHREEIKKYGHCFCGLFFK